MKRKFDYHEAVKRMLEGELLACGGGNYDYYVVVSNRNVFTIKGQYSADDELYDLTKEEYEILLSGNWYSVY